MGAIRSIKNISINYITKIMTKNGKNDIIKKRRRLSKFTFNMLIKSLKPIDDSIDQEIQDIYENYLYVHTLKRPDEKLEGNIKSIDPELIKIDDNTYQFILNISTYTVLKFDYSQFARDLNKIYNYPIGTIKVNALTANERIKKASDDIPPVQHTEIDEKKITEDVNSSIDEKKFSEELVKKIDEEIENDNSISLRIPEKYIEASNEIIPQGKSSLPPMPALQMQEEKNEEKTEDKKPDFFSKFDPKNILFGIGGLLLGINLSGSSNNSSYRPIYI